LGLPTWSAQITRSGAVPNDEANDQAVVQIGGSGAHLLRQGLLRNVTPKELAIISHGNRHREV
jgi:hypothetical protein